VDRETGRGLPCDATGGAGGGGGRAMRRIGILAAGMAVALGGCGPDPRVPWRERPVEQAAARTDATLLRGGAERWADATLQEQPFARGDLALLWQEGGRMQSATLVPCRGGTVCLGHPEGPAGTVGRSPSYLVVGGLMGRTFWLHPGGGGYVERGGHLVPLAWDARANGTGPGTERAMETPAPHG
jgi:hypothetical protein